MGQLQAECYRIRQLLRRRSRRRSGGFRSVGRMPDSREPVLRTTGGLAENPDDLPLVLLVVRNQAPEDVVVDLPVNVVDIGLLHAVTDIDLLPVQTIDPTRMFSLNEAAVVLCRKAGSGRSIATLHPQSKQHKM